MADISTLLAAVPDFTDYPGAAVAGAALIVTKAAPSSEEQHIVSEVTVSLDSTPTNSVTVTLVSGSTTLFRATVKIAGLWNVQFKNPRAGEKGASMVLTISAPGGTTVADGGFAGFTRQAP